MPNQFFPEAEHQALEADMQRLAEEVKRHRETPEARHWPKEELLKKSIQSLVSTSSPVSVESSSANLSSSGEISPEARLEVDYLLDLAFHQGILKADAEARKVGPFVLDAFHDVLVKKLSSKFEEKGLL